MKRFTTVAMLVMFAVLPLVAQAPKGWKVRADRSTSASDPDAAGTIKFATSGSGFHATNPQAAVFWNPANTVTGNYSLKGTFKLMKPSGHTNYYGLVFGGSDLEGPKQTYLYFLVAQDGTWIVKRRDGDAATKDVAKAANDAVYALVMDVAAGHRFDVAAVSQLSTGIFTVRLQLGRRECAVGAG